MAVNSVARLQARLRAPRLHADASPELKKARALLALMPKMDEARWTEAVKKLYRSERVEGPRATSWLLNVLAAQAPGGRERLWLRAQADNAMEEACQQRRLRKGWQQLGVDDPWWAVHDPPKAPWLARYNSEPCVKWPSCATAAAG